MAPKPKRGLGKGLDALLGEFTEPTVPQGVVEADIRLLDVNKAQPRKQFDEEKLNELADSIRRHGVVQPILVRKKGERYTIVAGERRYRAARLACLATVPVVVRELEDQQVMEVALIENIQRENLNPVEEAAAIRFLMKQHDLTQEEVAEQVLQIPYDPSKTSIPVLMLCGTENDVITPDNMEKSYAKVTAPKAMAVRTGANHGEMLYAADGYVTAWFMWHLQSDTDAAKAFIGEAPELLTNPLYQNPHIEIIQP